MLPYAKLSKKEKYLFVLCSHITGVRVLKEYVYEFETGFYVEKWVFDMELQRKEKWKNFERIEAFIISNDEEFLYLLDHKQSTREMGLKKISIHDQKQVAGEIRVFGYNESANIGGKIYLSDCDQYLYILVDENDRSIKKFIAIYSTEKLELVSMHAVNDIRHFIPINLTTFLLLRINQCKKLTIMPESYNYEDYKNKIYGFIGQDTFTKFTISPDKKYLIGSFFHHKNELAIWSLTNNKFCGYILKLNRYIFQGKTLQGQDKIIHFMYSPNGQFLYIYAEILLPKKNTNDQITGFTAQYVILVVNPIRKKVYKKIRINESDLLCRESIYRLINSVSTTLNVGDSF